MKHTPDTNIRLDVDASTARCVVPEAALVKLHFNKFDYTLLKKKESIYCLCKNIGVVDSLDTPKDESLTGIAMCESKEEMRIKRDYTNTRFLVFSSNRCEQNFSAARRALIDYQKLTESTSF